METKQSFKEFLEFHDISCYKIAQIMGEEPKSGSKKWVFKIKKGETILYTEFMELCRRLELFFLDEKRIRIKIDPEMFTYAKKRIVLQ